MSESKNNDDSKKNDSKKNDSKKKDSKKNDESGKIAQSFLYMFEFVVDDLLITRQNLCAPEEYPTCTEITFRSSVYVSICDRELGTCVTPCSPKCGKCVMFTLDGPITDKDTLQVHVYKKRTESCKFLIGLTEVKVKPIFDRVMESFDAENPNWECAMMGHIKGLPKMKGPNSKGLLDNCACYEKLNERHEQWCPTSELSKRLLPLFNLCKMQTGNIVLIMRLVCNGPAVVSSFPFSRVCSRNPNQSPPEPCGPPPCPPPPCCGGKPSAPPSPDNATASGGPMNKKPCCKGCCPPPEPPVRTCKMVDPCAKQPEPIAKCLRYYACNMDKLCPTDYCEDEFDRECPTVPSKRANLSPIEQKLEKCGPCGGISRPPPAPQDKSKKDDKKDKKDKKDKDKEKDDKDGKGKKKRQTGGGVYCVGDFAGPSAGPSAVYEAECEPVCDGVLQATRKMRYPCTETGMGMSAHREPRPSCNRCQAEYNVACDDARKRAVRKLRHLLVKYNIKIEN